MNLLQELRDFTGSGSFIRYTNGHILTQGIVFLAEKAQCYWLLDIVISVQSMPKMRANDFQVWTVDVEFDSSAVVICDDGNGNELYRQNVEYTDFPLADYQFYAVRNETSSMTILLKSEY